MVGNVENSCIQKSFRPSTATNWSWIYNPRGRGTGSMHLFFLSLLLLYLTNLAHLVYSNKMVQNPWQITGSHSTFSQLPLMLFFFKRSPPMKKVIMTVQPDSPQSASKRRQISESATPQVPTKKRKIFTRRIIKKTAQPPSDRSDSNTNQVIHSPKLFLKNSFLMHMYSGWL